MTVKECKRRMEHSEYICWQAYHKIEPYGTLEMKKGFAYIVAMLLNWCGWDKDSVKNMETFFPELGQPKKATNWDDTENQILLAKMWVLSTGGKVIEGKTDG